MAVRWAESFDNMNTGDISARYTTVGGSYVLVGGRFGNGIRCQANNTQQFFEQAFSAQGTWVVGFAFRTNGTPSSTWGPICRFKDGATDQIAIYLLPTLQIYIQDQQTGGINVTCPTILSPGTWYYVEAKVVVHNSTGQLSLRVDEGATVSSAVGDTSVTGANQADRVRFSGNTGTGPGNFTVDFDDIYILDGTVGAGSDPCNDMLGDMRVESLLPDSNGANSMFIGADADSIDNFAQVDEASPDLVTYVESAVSGAKDTYGFAPLSTAAGSIKAVFPCLYCEKLDAGARTVASVARLGATEVDSAAQTVSTNYRMLRDVRETKPGGGDWTIADVNAAEFGPKVIT